MVKNEDLNFVLTLLNDYKYPHGVSLVDIVKLTAGVLNRDATIGILFLLKDDGFIKMGTFPEGILNGYIITVKGERFLKYNGYVGQATDNLLNKKASHASIRSYLLNIAILVFTIIGIIIVIIGLLNDVNDRNKDKKEKTNNSEYFSKEIKSDNTTSSIDSDGGAVSKVMPYLIRQPNEKANAPFK